MGMSEARNSGRNASGASRGIMRGFLLLGLLSLGVIAGSVQRAEAATTEGTLITNVATSTYGSVQFTEYTVSYSVTAYVLVARPTIQIRKWAAPTVACSGQTVEFCIQVVNESLFTSAFNVILTDRINFPNSGYAYVGLSLTSWFSDPVTTVFPGKRDGVFPNVYSPGEPADNLGADGHPWELKWGLNMLGPTA